MRFRNDAFAEPGKIGLSGILDGKHSIDLGDVANFDFDEPFTLSAWVKPTTADGGVIGRYHETERGYGLFLIGGKLQLRVDTASISDRVRVETAEPIALEQWTHLTATYDGSRLAAG